MPTRHNYTRLGLQAFCASPLPFRPEFRGGFFMQCAWKALRNVVTVTGTKSSEGAVELVLPGRQYAFGNAHVLWRSAFQARRPRLAFPGTAYPVTKKLRFCSAFQALNT